MTGNVQLLAAPRAMPIRQPASRSEPVQRDVFDMSTLLSTLWRGKFLILLVVALAVAAGTYYAYLIATPRYQSTAVVMLDPREEQVVDIESVIGGLSADASVVNTEVEVLKSRGLLAKVVAETDLSVDPEFNRFLREPDLLASMKLTAKRALGLTQAPDPSNTDSSPITADVAAIDGLLERLTIRNVPNSLVFHVTVDSTDPVKAAQIANSVVEQYVLNQLEVKFDATEQATTWLTDRVADLRDALEAAEAEVTAYRAKTDLINPQALQALEIQLKDVRDRLSDTEAALAARQDKLEALAVADNRRSRAQITGDAQLKDLLPRVSDAGVAATFDARFSQVVGRIEAEETTMQERLAELTASYDEMNARIENQSDDLITLQQLTREAEASRLLYEYFLARLKETSAQQGVQQADSRILSAAVIPTLPATPQRALILALCALLGAVLGSALVFWRESRNDTFRTASSLEDVTGYPVMGQIATFPSRSTKDALAYLMAKPNSEAAESVRNLRTSLLLSDADRPPQVMLVSSSLPGEGKSTMALALAQNLAGMGKRVLLIEGDIRRRDFTNLFGQDRSAGLLSVMTGESRLQDAVLSDDATGIDILLGDQGTYNAADVFSSERFRDLVAEMRGFYDHIVIDTPPVLVVPDARIIAQQSDAILFVVKWDRTLKSQVREALSMFESVKQPISGLALTQISPRGMKRYGYSGYSAYGRKYYVN